MFYYKNKVKPIVRLCTLILVLAVTVSFCMWDDTSLKSLTANAGTADFTGKPPYTSNLELGDRSMLISGVTYTVVNKYEVGGVKFITLLSDTIGILYGSWHGTSDKHDGTSSAYDNSGADGIKDRITNYYNSYVNGKEISVGGNNIGVINDELYKIVGHLGGNGELWAPSEHEMFGTQSNGDMAKDGNQPQMKWIIENGNVWHGAMPGSRNTGASYWLRSPYSGNIGNSCSVLYDGNLSNYNVNYNNTVRVALNLKS